MTISKAKTSTNSPAILISRKNEGSAWKKGGTKDFYLAALDAEAQERVIEIVEAARDEGSLEEVDLDEVLLQEEEIASRREQAEVWREEKETELEEGDLQAAQDAAVKAGHELKAASERDGEWDANREEDIEVAVAADDVVDVEAAQWHEATAHENAEAAIDYAESGDYETAEVLDEAAGDAEDVAEAEADHADDEASSYDDDAI